MSPPPRRVSRVLIGTWHCWGCEQTGEGTQKEVERAAQKHTDTTGHATSTHYGPPETKEQP